MELNEKNILKLNEDFHYYDFNYDYHMCHLIMAKNYALELNHRLRSPIKDEDLTYAALAHDIMKLNVEKRSGLKDMVIIEGTAIPMDINRYVRTNLERLADWSDLDEYFNTDVQLHALASGLLMQDVFDTNNSNIIYPIFLHSCPIMPVYGKLDSDTKLAVDIMMLADKLSSNYLKINLFKSKVRVKLEDLVFGFDGREFNWSLGLFAARLIGQGNSREPQSMASTQYYYNALKLINPFINGKASVEMLGKPDVFPCFKSCVVEEVLHYGSQEEAG